MSALARRAGLAEGVEHYEVVGEETGEPLAILDLAWPDRVQLELTEAVALARAAKVVNE